MWLYGAIEAPVSKTKYGCTCIYLKDDLGFISQINTPTNDTASKVFIPPSECSHNEIIKTTDKS